MYSVLDYGRMAADGVRLDAYARAIERAVKPGSVVLDIGAGTGFFSLLAAKAGARRVHAVEPNPAIWLLPELARENGLEDRITIHHTSSLELELPEKADVVISDLRGSFPLYDEHLAVLRDAKTRLLAPNGVLMPTRDVLYAGLVESPDLANRLAGGTVAFERHGLGAEAARRSILNTPLTDDGALRSNDLLTTSAAWGTIEYGVHEGVVEGEIELVTKRRGTAHAIATWFSATVMDDIVYANEPGSALVYSRFVFPLLEPVELEHGDRARVLIRADETGNRWAWETSVTGADGKPKASMRQSSFFGMPTSPEALLRGSTSYAGVLSPYGGRVKKTLELMDGKRTVADIAREVRALDPKLPERTILEEVRSVVARYGR